MRPSAKVGMSIEPPRWMVSLMTVDQARDLMHALLAGGAFGGAAGGLRHQRVEMVDRKLGRRAGALGVEQHVAGKKQLPVLVVDLDAGGAGDVAGLVEDDLDVVPGAVKFLGVAVGQGCEAARRSGRSPRG